jgi:AhpD family alkylhydroperoxidase
MAKVNKVQACRSTKVPEGTGGSAQSGSLYSPAVDELVAISAAIACNCERCFKYHFARAKELGVTNQDMARAVATGQKVKTSPARAILELAQRHLHGAVIPLEDAAATDACARPELDEPDNVKAGCCSKNG